MSGLNKAEKDKQKLIQEKCQTILSQMLRDEDNKYCVDCDAKGPRWASWNLGIFLCIRCAGIHRNLGVHISRVKSVNLDSWTPEQVTSLQQMGNSRARAVYEAYLPENFRRPQADSPLETFIRAKYEHKKYIAKEWVCPPPLKISWDAEIELELKRKKEAKRKMSNGGPAIELQTSAGRPRAEGSPSSSPSLSAKESPVISKTPVPIEKPASKISSAAQDLFGLDTASSNDLFSGMTSTSSAAFETPDVPAVSGDEDNFFNQKAPTATEKKTMDKNSIMALYNQSSPAPNSTMFSTVPGNMYGGISSPMSSVPAFGQGIAAPMTSGPAFSQGVAAPMTSVSAFGQGFAAPMTSASAFGQGITSPMTSASAFGQGIATPMTSASAFGQGVNASMTSIPTFGQSVNAPMTSIPTFSQTGMSPMGNRPAFGQTSTSMNSASSMMSPGFNPMMQGNMFSNQMFATNGQTAANPMPQMTQLSQQMMGMNMNMGPSPTMYQPNPNVAPMSGAQFIPGRTTNPSTMGTQAAAQVNNPYAFLSSGQTLSTNLWQ